MDNLWVLLKADLTDSFTVNRILGKFNKNKFKGILVLIGIIFLLLFAEIYFFSVAFMLGAIAKVTDALFILLGISFLFETLWTLLSSIRFSSVYLFKFRDFDMLMSMPISPSTILTEKIIKFYLSNLYLTFLIMLPFLITYGILSGSGFIYYFMALFMLFFVPMIPTVAGAVVSFPLLALAAKFGKTELLNTITTIIVTVITLIISMGAGNISSYIDLDNISFDKEMLWDYIAKYPPAKWFTESLANFNLISLFLFLLINMTVFIIFITIFKSSFTKINSSLTETPSDKSYKFKEQKVSSVFFSLTSMEIKKYFSSATYVLNTCIGGIMSVIFVISGLINWLSDILDGDLFGYGTILPVTIFIIMISFIMNISPTTSSSISIEGKKYWILKTLPVKTDTIFLSKCIVNYVINLPALLICVVAASIVLKLTLFDMVIMFTVPFLTLTLSTIMGLYFGIRFPKIHWTTPQQVIKQSMSVVVTMIFSVIVNIFLGIFTFINIMNIVTESISTVHKLYYILIFVLIVLCGLAWLLVKIRGEKLINKIE